MSRPGAAWWVGCAVGCVVALLGTGEAHAQWELWESESTSGEVGANLQLMTAYVDVGELGGLAGVGEEAGLGAAVGRLEWSFGLGSKVDVDLHNRFFWQSSTLPEEFLFQGFEVSAGADRRVDTQWTIIDGDAARLVHDIDRFVVGVYFDQVDIYLGRQAIRWGVADLFPVADRFAPLSPFELDTLQRRGVDAARAVAHLSSSWEVDLVVADRGEGEPVAVGARVEYFGSRIDAYAGGGRFWERLSALGGVSVLAGHWKVFGEGEMLWNLDEEQLDRPRATLGAQRVSMDWQVGVEYHYNGFGTARDGEYFDDLGRPELARGETYFLGRQYGGVSGFYFFEAGWIVGGGAMANIVDPSVVIFPSVRYELEEQFSVGAGAYVGFGEGGDGQALFPSEYGSVPDLYFVQMTAFF